MYSAPPRSTQPDTLFPYTTLFRSADNKGQGGTLALVAMLLRKIGRTRYAWITVMLAVFATALFYGDSMITPEISVLSAVERSEEHTSELKSLMRISYAVYCLKKKK